MKKRGVSPIIATVMIILITFVAVGLVWAFILPMIQQNLESGANCFELREHVKVVASDFTCYDDDETQIMIERGLDNLSIQGIAASITFEAESKRYDIKNVGSTAGVSMYAEGDVELPAPGEARTYVFDRGNGEKVELGVVSGGNVCGMGTYNIPPCAVGLSS